MLRQQEYDVLKEAYDNYSADTGRRSTHSSPRKIRAKRPDASSSSRNQPTTERPVDGLKRRRSQKPLSYKHVRPDFDDEQGNDANTASRLDAGSLRPPKPKSARSVSDAGSLETSVVDPDESSIRGGAPPLQPRRRLLSKNQISDQEETRRRASMAAEKSPKHDELRRKSSDASLAGDGMKVQRSSSPVKVEGGRKRQRTSISPRSSISEPSKPQDAAKKKRRVDSQGNAIKQMTEERTNNAAVVASMIASPAPMQSPVFGSGSAPVANMGGNPSFSPTVGSPNESKASPALLLNSIDRSRKRDSPSSTSTSLIHNDPLARRSPSTNPKTKENNFEEASTAEKCDNDKKAQNREVQVEKEDREEQDETEREIDIRAARKRKIEASRQQQSEDAREQEEARLKAQREADETSQQLQKEREQEEARETKKRNEDMLARRAEQERQRKEKEERRRVDMEHREEERRLRLAKEREQQRREALPNGLKKAAELSAGDARDPEWVNKWLPLYTVETQDLDPGCARDEANELWITNVQVAPVLAITDLELSQCKSHFPS